jgi:acyl dehydratase
VHPVATAAGGPDRIRGGLRLRSLPARKAADAGDDPMTTILDIDQLRDAVGREIAVSDWFEVSQTVIDEFAEATRDAQWIHVDTERAARESPFLDSAGRRCTVAHGFLTLSLLTVLIENCLRIAGVLAGVNIGFDRVRFVSPVPAGSLLRGRFALAQLEDVVGGVQLTWLVTVERQGESRPALTAEWLTRVVL